MTIHFTKMQGLGNDFVVIDAVNQSIVLKTQQIKQIADRHFGIGCDQVLLIEKPVNQAADFFYRIYNADGSEAEQCGNGARCIGLYLWTHKCEQQRPLTLQTLKGLIEITSSKSGDIAVNMGVPNFLGQHAQSITVADQSFNFRLVDIGNPHAVTFVDAINKQQVAELGETIANLPQFEQGTNVEFVVVQDSKNIQLAVYERGVGPTLACGSGACAAVVAGRAEGLLDAEVAVKQSGGVLAIEWLGNDQPIRMSGAAEFVFTGEWCLEK